MRSSFPKLSSSKPIVIFGVFPVIHKGYLDVCERYAQQYAGHPLHIFILSRQSLPRYLALEPDIRQLDYELVARFFSAMPSVAALHEISDENFSEIVSQIAPALLVAFEHDETKRFLSEDDRLQFLQRKEVQVILEEHLLHWAKQGVVTQEAKSDHDAAASVEEYKKFLLKAASQAQHSGCFWRQVGALLVKDGKEVTTKYNEMAPAADECYKVGCVRDDIKPGERVELCSAIHAEAAVIAQAAKEGVSVAGTTLYVTTFPCPICAKLIAFSGIQKVVYAEGWSTFDGEQVLKSRGVKLIHVPLPTVRKKHAVKKNI